MSLGEKIKEQRKSRGLSQEEVAELVGVSRQAVTKWETNRSAPATANLFKLADVLGTSVDFLLNSDTSADLVIAEQIHRLYKAEEEKKLLERLSQRRKNIITFLLIIAVYLFINLIPRIIESYSSDFESYSSGYGVIIDFFVTGEHQFPYLFGWLIDMGLFWLAMAISAIPALFAKRLFSITATFAFIAGLIIGDLFGENSDPVAQFYGQSHYGWIMWINIFLFGLIMGIILEILKSKNKSEDKIIKSKYFRIWALVLLVGILVISILSVYFAPIPGS